MVISSETWQTIEGLFQRGSKVSWQSLIQGGVRRDLEIKTINMTHSVSCPRCQTVYKDEFNILHISDSGMCYDCFNEQDEDESRANEDPFFEEYLSKQ